MTAPRDTWLIAGTSTYQPYPCRCQPRYGRACNPRFCPCAGRLDTDRMPSTCCSHVNTPAAVTAANRAAGW